MKEEQCNCRRATRPASACPECRPKPEGRAAPAQRTKPRTKYQRGQLAIELARAIEQHAPDPALRALAAAITVALAAPAEILSARWPHIEDLLRRAGKAGGKRV